ncbi:hypothetical protein [Oceanirhabdus sp. W0125-5]|uniref:hypothetical protein n=1 Tax=Oceanirhabdus sp. W0125-5 TaxID=2999116 RepID=UPI0022F2C84B|nr:hypothetical protein [Oceanirhabdus sp. W0125-5]WBW98842.1 hypothetical protein OW730_08900 [Oceanirhabdus sp. W0125-5]
MSNKITIEHIKDIYEQAEKVYLKRIDRKSALDILSNKGINRGSSSCYFLTISDLLDGKSYTRTISEIAYRYIFEEILKKYGKERLDKALTAAAAHVEYYKRYSTLKSVTGVIEEYRKKCL